MIHKTHVLLKQYGERGIILTKRNLSLSMKIVLLLLSSAILAILCYAFFRNNVTDFYTFIETVEKPFNEKTFIKGFTETITFKDGEGIVYVSSMHLLKYIKYYFYCALFVSLLLFFLPTFIFIRKKVKYINILKEEVLNMSQGDLNHPMTIKSHDELSIWHVKLIF